ncbi:MAG: hypothetical protein KQH59_18120 [Desulfobulbaceae bacterium]|nr:hypothetical protein [Desulfobulbaceae bacterium]
MKRLIFTTLLLLLASPALAWNWPVITAMQAGSEAPAGNSDDFSGTLSNWSASADGIANLEIDSNDHLRLNGNYRSGSMYYTSSTSDVSQVVVLAGATNGYFWPQVCVRMSGAANGYCFALIENDGTDWADIVVYKNGVALCYLAGTYSASANQTIKIVATGTSPVTINAYVGGSEVTDGCSDSTDPIASGAPGIKILGSSAADYANNLVDDWQDYE